MPDPGRITGLQDFGRELSLARQQAGLTIREVARASGIPASTVGDYFAGRHLPPVRQPELLTRVLAACGITDTEQADRWQEALNRIRRMPGRPSARGRAPYWGLATFQPEDAAWFFGRDQLVLHLVRLATGPGTPGLPLAVVGPSGSGKSSLLRAGLVPRLRTATPARPGGRPVALITPGASPVDALARGLASLAGPGFGGLSAERLARGIRENPERYARLAGRGDEPPAIIVDQLEEIFTAGAGGTGRQEFVAALAALAEHTLIVTGLRADFYSHALSYPVLARSLQERQIVVGPMSADQLRRAIVAPAHKAGLDIDDGLVEVLLADMRPYGAAGPGAGGHEAGALPLLSHALLATWEHSRGGRLTVSDYQASGGIRDAITRTAEHAYATLGAGEQDVARQLFLRLVHVGDDGRETRARLPRADLPGDATVAAAVLERFVGQRLITMDRDETEITHEALLGAWPRLRGWIDSDREDLRIRRSITVAAQAWDTAGREPAALLRGGQLALARDWAATGANRASLSQLGQDFVDAGIAEERAQRAAERRRTRRLRQLVAALTAVVVVAVGLAGYAFRQRQIATTAKEEAESRTVAVEAGQARPEDPALAAQLSLAAYRIWPSAGARASLLESSGAPSGARLFDSDGVVQAVALAGDHRLLAVAAADGTLRLWNVSRPGRPALIRTVVELGRQDPQYAVTFSPGGHVLAAAGADGAVRLWNVADPSHPKRLGTPLTGPRSTVYSLAFSPDGRLLAEGSADETVRLWNVSDPAHPVAEGAPLTGFTGYVHAVAFSPHGRLLAAGSADKTVRLWDVSDPHRPRLAAKPLTGPTDIVNSIAFSPDGKDLAAGGNDDKVWRWNIANPAKPSRLSRLSGATNWVMAVAFSPGGQVLAEGGSDDQVRLWSTETGAPLAVIPEPQPVTSLTWDGPGTLITGDADGYVRAWRVPVPELMTGGPAYTLAFSPGGSALAVGSTGLQLWNPATHDLIASAAIPRAGQGNIVNAVAFSPGGNLIATGYGDGHIQLWRSGAHLVPLGTPQAASRATPASGGNAVEFVAFRPGGDILASAADDGTVRLWNVANPAKPALVSTLRASADAVFSVAFGAGGRLLAASSADDKVRLWNVANPAAPVRLGKALTGPVNTAYSVAFSPRSHLLAVGSADRDVRLWDISDPARPHRIGPVLTGPSGYVYSVAFGPGGRVLAAGNTDGSVWLWSLSDPAHPGLIATLTGPAGHVFSVGFGRGGRTVAAADSSGLVWLWNIQAGAVARGVCAMAGQPLARDEWHVYVPGLPYAPPCRLSLLLASLAGASLGRAGGAQLGGAGGTGVRGVPGRQSLAAGKPRRGAVRRSARRLRRAAAEV
jgi:WD40 repeat protein/transcriptional regulator with XRE-family HTH domain